MTGTTTRGKTIVFRPSVVGRAIDPYAGYEDRSLLKIGAYHGRAATGTPIMGFFNVTSEFITELVHISRFSGVVPNTGESSIREGFLPPFTFFFQDEQY